MRYIYDFPYKTNSKGKTQSLMKGGTLEGEKRKEYLNLCYSLRKKHQDQGENVLYLLQYLKDYIEPMVPPDKVGLFTQIFSILDDVIEMSDIDTNYLSIINLVSLQCTILLTDYSEEARRDPSFMLYISDPYNDPTNPEPNEEFDDFYGMYIKDLQNLSDDKLHALTKSKLDQLDDAMYEELFQVYRKDKEDEMGEDEMSEDEMDEDEIISLLKKSVKKDVKNRSTFYTVVFDELLKCNWTNYFELKKHIIKTPLLHRRFSPLIYSDNGKEYRFLPPKKNTNIFLAVILGEMTLSELLTATANQIYFIGVVLEDTNADGYRYNPFLFFYHDIDHAKGDVTDRLLLSLNQKQALNKKMIRFITSCERKVSEGLILPEKYNNIMFWLFLLAHEFSSSINLLLQRSSDLNTICNSLLGVVLFPPGTRTPYLFRFKNELDIGGLIPPQYRKNVYKIVEDGIKPDYRNLMDDKRVPLFFKLSVIDFVREWYFIPNLNTPSKTRSLENKKSKTKTRKHKSI